MAVEETRNISDTLRLLVFQMFTAGQTQDEIAAYIGKSKTTVNAILKPLQRVKREATVKARK